MRSSPEPNDDSTQVSILFADSGPSIGYGPNSANEQDLLFAQPQVVATNSQIDAEIDALIGLSKRHPYPEQKRRPHQHDSLLARSRRLGGIATAATGVMVTDQESRTSEDLHDPDPLDDCSETQFDIPVCVPQLSNCTIAYSNILTHFANKGVPAAESLDDPSIRTDLALCSETPKKPTARSRKTPPLTTLTQTRLPEFWGDCPDIYPDRHEIFQALQDLGRKQTKVVSGCPQQVTTFPLIQKLSTKIYQKIQSIYKPEGLTKNQTRGRESLAALILVLESSLFQFGGLCRQQWKKRELVNATESWVLPLLLV